MFDISLGWMLHISPLGLLQPSLSIGGLFAEG
jgi:hypothetical protein